jgi:polyferredoxin
MSRKTIVFIFIILIALTAVFAEFGPPASSEVKEFLPPSSEESSYWFHDLFLKIITVSALIFASLLVFLFLRTKKWARKLMLISSVIIIGLIFGGFLCPSSAVQNIMLKAGTAYLILFSIPLIATFIFGRIYCGSVCPYGAISELLHIKKFAIKVPKKADKVLKYVKYGILVFLVLRVLFTGEVVGNTPFKAIFVFGGATLDWVMTGIFVFLSLFIYRPFCKYFCPYGAIMSIIAKFSIFRIKKDESCVSCRICEKECPMDAMDDHAVTDSECILCGECCNKCPKDSLKLRFSTKNIKDKN